MSDAEPRGDTFDEFDPSDGDADLGLDGLAEPDDQGLSLEELSEAYAALIGSGDDPYADRKPRDDGDKLDADKLDADKSGGDKLDGNNLDGAAGESAGGEDAAGETADDASDADRATDADTEADEIAAASAAMGDGDESGETTAASQGLSSGTGSGDESSAGRGSVEPKAARGAPSRSPSQDDGSFEVSPLSILEAMLFVGHPENLPLTSKHVAGMMRGVRPREIDDLVAQLNETYRAEECPYHVVSIDSGYRLELRPELARLRDKFYGRVRAARLTQAAVDTLAIVAYHQPVTKDDVERLRGRPAAALLRQLVRRDLLAMERPDKKPRRPLFRTTDRFLDVFGLDSLDDLPRSHELDR